MPRATRRTSRRTPPPPPAATSRNAGHDGEHGSVGTRAVPLIEPRQAIDEVDRQLIDVLVADGRASNRSMAERVGLPETTVSGRVRRLTERGVIHVTAVTDWQAAGYDWNAAACIKVEGRPPRTVASDIAQIPEVYGLALVYGHYDLVAHVLLRDRAHVHKLMKEELPGIPGVRDVTFNLITDVVGFRMGATSKSVGPQLPLHLPAPRIPLDDIDVGLIEALAIDGRRSNREIARQLEVSEGTIRSRLRRLEDAKLLSVVAVTDRAVLGDVGAIAIIGIEVDGPIASAVAAKLARSPEIYLSNVTVGRYDVMLIAATPTRAELGELTAARLRSIHGVRSTETLDVMEVPKHLHRWVRIL